MTASDAALRRFLQGLPGVDHVGADARAATLATRSIKTTAKAFALDLAISMIDLTTLEGQDTPGKVRAMCAKALRPDPADPTCPPVAAVCVYGDLVSVARESLGGGRTGGGSTPIGAGDGNTSAGDDNTAVGDGNTSAGDRNTSAGDDNTAVGDGADGTNDGADGSGGVPGLGGRMQVAAVATAFPSGRASLDVKLADVKAAVAAGADEIDMVIDRGAFLAGRYLDVHDEIVATRQACGDAHLKVILETGELATYDNVRRASWLAMLAGADFVKTSTGKVSPAATLPVTLVMLEAVRDFRDLTGRHVGVKAAGGIRTAKDAIRYLVLVNETAGDDWLTPDGFRLGASTLLNDLLMQRRKLATGHYAGPDYFTLD
ncbi:MAG: deoxyribose-phosphate aldolase [Acidimicrobiales bacterium]